jgi:hypothetical protein
MLLQFFSNKAETPVFWAFTVMPTGGPESHTLPPPSFHFWAAGFNSMLPPLLKVHLVILVCI